jgi:hypothetical protein
MLRILNRALKALLQKGCALFLVLRPMQPGTEPFEQPQA